MRALRTRRGAELCVIFPAAFDRDHARLRFPVHVRNRERPERHQIDSGQELAQKRWQKFPMPSKQVSHSAANGEIERVIRRRFSALDEQRQDGDLQRIRDDRQDEGGAKARTLRECDRVVSHGNLMLSFSRSYSHLMRPFGRLSHHAASADSVSRLVSAARWNGLPTSFSTPHGPPFPARPAPPRPTRPESIRPRGSRRRGAPPAGSSTR